MPSKRLIWVCLALLMVGLIRAEDSGIPPYIYYYSHGLNGIVIERADGTDSRIIGQGLVETPKLVDRVAGPGWSPDGKWFAWMVDLYNDNGGYYPPSQGNGYVVSVDGQRTSADLFQYLRCVMTMNWSPDSRWLLISGAWQTNYYASKGCAQTEHLLTYWLIDMTTLEIAAHYESYNEQWSPVPGKIFNPHWDMSAQQVQFSRGRSDFPPIPRTAVTLFFDGRVIAVPISDGDPAFASNWTEDDSESRGFVNVSEPGVSLASPDHRYDFDFSSQSLVNVETSISQPVPPDSGPALTGYVVAIDWHESSQYAFMAYERCTADCGFVPGHVSIVSVDGDLYRELSNCGAENACINWLPEQVNIADLPSGSSSSVVPTPIKYEYTEPGDYPVIQYQLGCNPQTGQRTLIRDIVTKDLVFSLPTGKACEEWEIESENNNPEWVPSIPFAISPRHHFYAIQDNEAFVELFDTFTNEHIANLNVNAVQIWFSSDETQLFTRTYYAVVTWDMASLIEASQP